MGSTNKTTYYELSQFIGTDKPAWLQDYNGDMLKIDTGINAAKVAADNAASAASNAQGDATDALTAIGNINTALGTIETTLGTAVGSINTINSLIGNGTPTTSNQTIIGAINALEASIAPSEDGDDLANSYSIGEQFTRGGTVYKALAPLTAGTAVASLVLNTDYAVSYTLVEQINDVDGKVDAVDTKVDAAQTVLSDTSVSGFTINRVGKVVVCGILLNDQTFAFGDVIGVIPEGYRPTFGVKAIDTVGGQALTALPNGNVTTDAAITSANIRATFTWITNDAVPE